MVRRMGYNIGLGGIRGDHHGEIMDFSK